MARFASWEAIPEKVRDELLAYGGPRYFENIRQELVGKAVLWMGSIGDRAVAVQMTRAGCEIARWFVPLRSHDLIIFAIGTTPEHRGKGIAPAMIRHIMAKELQDDGKAYIDCKVWNKPAIRGFEKAGFRRLVTRKPLPRTRRPR